MKSNACFVIGCIYGLCLFASALLEIGFNGTILLTILVIIGAIICEIEDKCKSRKESRREL